MSAAETGRGHGGETAGDADGRRARPLLRTLLHVQVINSGCVSDVTPHRGHRGGPEEERHRLQNKTGWCVISEEKLPE